MEQTLDLVIEGMHCAACVRRVTAALDALDGVSVGTVEVGSASVVFRPEQITTAQIYSAIDRIGFKVAAASGAGDK